MTVRAPIDSHGASKWMIERLLAEYRRAYRFGAFWQDSSAQAVLTGQAVSAKKHHNETHLIPRAMMALEGHVGDLGCSPMTSTRQTGPLSGKSIWPPRISRRLRCCFRDIQGQLQSPPGQVSGREVPHVIEPRRAGGPIYLVADPSAARNGRTWCSVIPI